MNRLSNCTNYHKKSLSFNVADFSFCRDSQYQDDETQQSDKENIFKEIRCVINQNEEKAPKIQNQIIKEPL